MFRSRLAIKITLLIVAVLIVGFGVSTIVTIQRESAALLEQNKQGVRRLTQAVVASVEAAMLQERPDVTRSLIQELRELRTAKTGSIEVTTRTTARTLWSLPWQPWHFS